MLSMMKTNNKTIMVMVVMMMVAANIIGFGGRAAAGSSGIHTVDDTEEKRGGCAFIYLFIDVSRNFSPTLHCLYYVQSNNRFNIVRSI